MRKLRILANTEFSELFTGYSTVTKQLFTRLHKTGKYILAEHANYYSPFNQGKERAYNVPWGVYGNNPDESNQQQMQEFNSDPINQFGKWRFNQVVLDFKPDVIFSPLDVWMMNHIIESHLRPYYKLVIQPAVDGDPQACDWIDKYASCDMVFTYSDWAFNLLKKQSGSMIKLGGTTSPAADPTSFFPIPNKSEHKIKFGLPGDSFIIGTVMRNQKRKLFNDLFIAFRKLLDKLPKDKADKTFLYCQTSHPDVGFDLGRLLHENNIGHKVFFTYLCRQSGMVYPSTFASAKSISPATNQPTANMPNTNIAVDSKTLGMIMNTFDCYVQASALEGFGVPVVEAGACNVPLFVVDYSAMEDFIYRAKATPIPVQRFVRESETHRYWAYFDIDKLVDLLFDFIQKPIAYQLTKAKETGDAIRQNFNWDHTAETYMNYFDSIEIKDWNETWNSPPRLFQPQINWPTNLSNEQIVEWGIYNVLGLPNRTHTYWHNKLVDQLDYGAIFVGANLNISDLSFLGIKGMFTPYTQQDMLKEMLNERNKINNLEMLRCGLRHEPIPDYILNYKKGEYENT